MKIIKGGSMTHICNIEHVSCAWLNFAILFLAETFTYSKSLFTFRFSWFWIPFVFCLHRQKREKSVEVGVLTGT